MQPMNPYQLVSVASVLLVACCLLGPLVSAVEGALSYPIGSQWNVNRTTSGSQWSGQRGLDGEVDSCNSDRLAIYKVVLHTYWTRDRFPKHYPDWRPPAQWSNTIGGSPWWWSDWVDWALSQTGSLIDALICDWQLMVLAR